MQTKIVRISKLVVCYFINISKQNIGIFFEHVILKMVTHGRYSIPWSAQHFTRAVYFGHDRGAYLLDLLEFVVERLHAWGVRKIFGYPGDGINGVFGALHRAERKIEFIQARHEEMAAFMASAYAKFTGQLGVCIATSGPGASHLVTGLYDARLDHMPVLAIAGQ